MKQKECCENCKYWHPHDEVKTGHGLCDLDRIFSPNIHSQLGGKLFTGKNFLCNQWEAGKEK